MQKFVDIEGWHAVDSRKADPKAKEKDRKENERTDLALTMRNAYLDDRFVFSLKRFNLENLVLTSEIKGTPVVQCGLFGLLKAFASETVYGVRDMENHSGIPFFVVKEKFDKLKKLLSRVDNKVERI